MPVSGLGTQLLTMQTVTTLAQLQPLVNNWRMAGKRIALVPTMGNLHEGHLRLVEVAHQQADVVIASIFVNPSQFGPGEDFDSYPRTEQQDQQQLTAAHTDCLFMPSVQEVYGDNPQTHVSVTGLASLHCGQSRPGHFNGVATIVCKLFNMVQPHCAVFGLKDFQQYTVIKTMVQDLNIPIEIIGVETVRDANGLAKSSRNSYLSDSEKNTAALLYQTLCQTREAIINGNRNYTELARQALLTLQNAGFQPDYCNICQCDTLLPAQTTDRALVILAAAKLGKARLIDNVHFDL